METQPTIQKPQSISIAANLIWASLAVGLVKILLDFSNLSAMGSTTLLISTLALTFAFVGLLVFMISAGKNWARITFLVLFIMGAIPTLPIILDELSRSPLVGVLSMVQMGLQAYALFILFTQPAKNWFRKTIPA